MDCGGVGTRPRGHEGGALGVFLSIVRRESGLFVTGEGTQITVEWTLPGVFAVVQIKGILVPEPSLTIGPIAVESFL